MLLSVFSFLMFKTSWACLNIVVKVIVIYDNPIICERCEDICLT